MKIHWNFIIAIAFFLVIVVAVFDIMGAQEGDTTLQQYEVKELRADLGKNVLQHLSDVSGLIKVKSEEIGKQGLTK